MQSIKLSLRINHIQCTYIILASCNNQQILLFTCVYYAFLRINFIYSEWTTIIHFKLKPLIENCNYLDINLLI